MAFASRHFAPKMLDHVLHLLFKCFLVSERGGPRSALYTTSLETLSQPHSRFGDKITLFSGNLSQKRDLGSERVSSIVCMSAGAYYEVLQYYYRCIFISTYCYCSMFPPTSAVTAALFTPAMSLFNCICVTPGISRHPHPQGGTLNLVVTCAGNRYQVDSNRNYNVVYPGYIKRLLLCFFHMVKKKTQPQNNQRR